MTKKEKKRRFGCLGKALALVLVGLGLIVLIGPAVAAPFVRRVIEERIAKETGGEATIEHLGFSFFGSAEIEGLDVRDAEGNDLASLDSARATFSPLDLIAGRLEFQVEAAGAEIHVQIEEDGGWSVGEIGGPSGAEEEEETEAVTGLPDVRGRFVATDTRIVLHGTDESTILSGGLDVDVERLDRPAKIRLDGRVAGPGGPAGTVVVGGEATLAAGGLDAGFQPEGRFRVDAEELRLEAFEPLVTLLAPVAELGGRVEGEVEAVLSEALALRVDTKLSLRELHVRGTEPDSSLDVALLEIEGGSESLAEDGYRQTLRLRADDFLALDYEGTLRDADGGGTGIEGTWTLDGSLAELTGAIRQWLPIKSGFAIRGTVRARNDLSVVLRDGELRDLDTSVDLGVEGLAVRDEEGRDVPLDDLENVDLRAKAGFDFDEGLLSVRELALTAGPIRAGGQVEVAGILASDGSGLAIQDSELALEADLDRLHETLSRFVDLEATPFGGRLTANLLARGDEERAHLTGDLHATGLVLGGGEEEAARELGDLEATFDATYVSADDRLELGSARVKSAPLEATAKGRIDRLTSGDDLALDLDEGVSTTLTRLLAELPPDGGFPIREGRGSVNAQVNLRGGTDELEIEGSAEITGLELGIETEATGEELWTIAESKVSAELRGTLVASSGNLSIERLALDSETARGEVSGQVRNLVGGGDESTGEDVVLEGVRGDLHYVPDRLGPLLAPWLPGRLSGEEAERVSFELEGRASEIDPLVLLAGTEGQAEVGLGRFELGGFDTDGTLRVDLGEKTAWEGEFSANGGTLTMTGEMDLREAGPDGAPPRSRIAVEMSGVGANSKLSPLLSMVHPAFAAVDNLEKGEIEGSIACDLDLTFDGALTPELLEGGWDALPKANLNGTGRLSISDAALRGSPLFDLMLGELGADPQRTMSIRPVEFAIEKGRLRYAKPWTWTIDGTKTTFTGSIGLDETLSLTWNVPIDDKLVAKHDYLRALSGEVIEVPLGGTVRSPRLDWQGVIGDLASKALQNEVKDRLGLNRDGGKSGQDPASMLREADRLWKEGKKVEAAAIYKEIREKHKVSVVYALNRDRIKKRAKYRE